MTCMHLLVYLAYFMVRLFSFQTETLTHYSTYEEKELIPTMNKLASLVIKAENSKLTVSFTAHFSN